MFWCSNMNFPKTKRYPTKAMLIKFGAWGVLIWGVFPKSNHGRKFRRYQ